MDSFEGIDKTTENDQASSSPAATGRGSMDSPPGPAGNDDVKKHEVSPPAPAGERPLPADVELETEPEPEAQLQPEPESEGPPEIGETDQPEVLATEDTGDVDIIEPRE